MRVALLAGRSRCSVDLGFLTARYLTPLLLLYTSLGAGKGITPQDRQTLAALWIPPVIPATPAPTVHLSLRVPLVASRHRQEHNSPLCVQTAAPEHCSIASWCWTVKPAGFGDLEKEKDEITTFERTFVLNPNHFPKCVNMKYEEIVWGFICVVFQEKKRKSLSRNSQF